MLCLSSIINNVNLIIPHVLVMTEYASIKNWIQVDCFLAIVILK